MTISHISDLLISVTTPMMVRDTVMIHTAHSTYVGDKRHRSFRLAGGLGLRLRLREHMRLDWSLLLYRAFNDNLVIGLDILDQFDQWNVDNEFRGLYVSGGIFHWKFQLRAGHDS